MLSVFGAIGISVSLLWLLGKLELLVWNKKDQSSSPSPVTQFMTLAGPFPFLNLSNIICKIGVGTLNVACGLVVWLLGQTAFENSL